MSSIDESRAAFQREQKLSETVRKLQRLLAAIIIEYGGDQLRLVISEKSRTEAPLDPAIYSRESDFPNITVGLIRDEHIAQVAAAVYASEHVKRPAIPAPTSLIDTDHPAGGNP